MIWWHFKSIQKISWISDNFKEVKKGIESVWVRTRAAAVSSFQPKSSPWRQYFKMITVFLIWVYTKAVSCTESKLPIFGGKIMCRTLHLLFNFLGLCVSGFSYWAAWLSIFGYCVQSHAITTFVDKVLKDKLILMPVEISIVGYSSKV